MSSKAENVVDLIDEEELIDENSFTKKDIPIAFADLQKIYDQLSNNAKSDNFFMACFWSSYGYPHLAENALHEYHAEFNVVKEYNNRIKTKNTKTNEQKF